MSAQPPHPTSSERGFITDGPTAHSTATKTHTRTRTRTRTRYSYSAAVASARTRTSTSKDWVRLLSVSHPREQRAGGPRSRALAPSDRQLADFQRRGGDAVAEDEIVADHLDALEHLQQGAGDGDLADREPKVPWLHPKAAGAARVVAGGRVDAESHQLRDIEAGLDRADDVLRRPLAGRRRDVCRA